MHSKTGTLVAIKVCTVCWVLLTTRKCKIKNSGSGEKSSPFEKYKYWLSCRDRFCRMVFTCLTRKGSHPNVVRLIEVIRHLKTAYLVFEWVEEDLNSFILTRIEKRHPIREVNQSSEFTPLHVA